MARHKEGVAAETLGEIEGAADRMSEWIQSNFMLVVCAVAGLLVLAGIGSYIVRSSDASEKAASQALAETRGAYMEAMGAGPGVIDIPELANAEAAAGIRKDFGAQFAQIADEHSGTVSGALARIEVGQLALAGGQTDEAVVQFETILEEGTPNSRLRGMVLQQLAQALEVSERWEDAAVRHEEAANLSEYPLRHWAMADSARCFHRTGNFEKARALFARLDVDAPDLGLPDHLRALKRELEATATP